MTHEMPSDVELPEKKPEKPRGRTLEETRQFILVWGPEQSVFDLLAIIQNLEKVASDVLRELLTEKFPNPETVARGKILAIDNKGMAILEQSDGFVMMPATKARTPEKY